MHSLFFKAAVIAVGAVAAHDVSGLFLLIYIAAQLALLALSLRSTS
jgi:hypothetical protein